MDISIIVPVYNIEKYLGRCLDSIFNQKFHGTFEVIAVDDGSTDKSIQILQEYQKKESRLRVITHGTNKKLSVTRTTGMKAALGDYIMHVDADDWIESGCLEKVFNTCMSSGADVVEFGILKRDEKGNSKSMNYIKKELITNDKLRVQKYFFGSVVSKIVKRNLTEDLVFGSTGVNATEDLIYSFEILLKAGRICLLPNNYYVYYENPKSLTHTVEPEEYLQNQVIVLLKQLQLVVDKHNADSQLTENLLNYYEKWLFLMIARIHFWSKASKEFNPGIISSFHKIPIMSHSRISKLGLAMTNKYRMPPDA